MQHPETPYVEYCLSYDMDSASNTFILEKENILREGQSQNTFEVVKDAQMKVPFITRLRNTSLTEDAVKRKLCVPLAENLFRLSPAMQDAVDCNALDDSDHAQAASAASGDQCPQPSANVLLVSANDATCLSNKSFREDTGQDTYTTTRAAPRRISPS